jgi:hypothetical protein
MNVFPSEVASCPVNADFALPLAVKTMCLERGGQGWAIQYLGGVLVAGYTTSGCDIWQPSLELPFASGW